MASPIKKLANIKVSKNFAGEGVMPYRSFIYNLVGSNTKKSPFELYDDYQGFVYKAIDVKARKVASVPYFMERKIGDTWHKDNSHPFYASVIEGSPEQPPQSFMRIGTTTYKQILGQAFWFIETGEQTGKPLDRFLLYPERMEVYVNTNNHILGYAYTKVDGERVPLTVNEIVHFKYFNPRNHNMGYSPLEAAGVLVDADKNTVKYLNNLMLNNAQPGGIVVLPSTTTKENFDSFETQWRSKYGGVDNAGKTAILQADGVDFKQTSQNLKDMNIDKLRQMSRDEVLAIFGVSKHMLGMTETGSSLGRATAEAHEYIFAKDVVEPEVKDDMEVLEDAFERFYPQDKDKWRVSFDTPIPEDKEALAKAIEVGKGAMSVNDIRSILGLEPINDPRADEVITDTPDAQPISTRGYVKPIRVKIKTTQVPKTVAKLDDSDYQTKENFRLGVQDRQTKYEKEYKKELVKFFEAQEKRVLDGVAPKNKTNISAVFRPNEEANLMIELSIGFLVNLIEEQGQVAMGFAGGTTDFRFTPEMRNTIQENLQKTTQKFTNDQLDRLTATITEGLQNGEGVAKMRARVEAQYSELKGWRAERLARTETLEAANYANLQGYKQLGITQKEWFANPGACEYCEALNGEVIEIEKDFLKVGETLRGIDGGERVIDYKNIGHPPSHSNCRCSALPVRVSVDMSKKDDAITKKLEKQISKSEKTIKELTEYTTRLESLVFNERA